MLLMKFYAIQQEMSYLVDLNRLLWLFLRACDFILAYSSAFSAAKQIFSEFNNERLTNFGKDVLH